LHELRRRRVFTTAGLYVVSVWLLLQVADVDRQRSEVQRIDARENFPALLDRAQAAKTRR